MDELPRYVSANCMARVKAFEATGVQYFCELDGSSRRALTDAWMRHPYSGQWVPSQSAHDMGWREYHCDKHYS